MKIWDASTTREFYTVRGLVAEGPVRQVALSPDGSRLAFASSDKFFVVDARTGQPVSTIQIPVRAGMVALSPDSTMVAVEATGSDPNVLVPPGIGLV